MYYVHFSDKIPHFIEMYHSTKLPMYNCTCIFEYRRSTDGDLLIAIGHCDDVQ